MSLIAVCARSGKELSQEKTRKYYRRGRNNFLNDFETQFLLCTLHKANSKKKIEKNLYKKCSLKHFQANQVTNVIMDWTTCHLVDDEIAWTEDASRSAARSPSCWISAPYRGETLRCSSKQEDREQLTALYQEDHKVTVRAPTPIRAYSKTLLQQN